MWTTFLIVLGIVAESTAALGYRGDYSDTRVLRNVKYDIFRNYI